MITLTSHLVPFQELLDVWRTQREQKKWGESHQGLGQVVIRRLVKLKGRKGFGNARAVRQKLEEACARAMARDDFDSTDLVLQIEDAVGENPINNKKLEAVLKDFEQKIGWTAAKEQAHNLVNVCSKNYERELKGLESIPVFLNCLFLGNPGTGELVYSGDQFIGPGVSLTLNVLFKEKQRVPNYMVDF